MTTHPAPERLGAYLDGELDASARATVDTHLRECAECAAHLADLSAVDDAARALPLEAPEGYFDDFSTRVRARLDRKAPARWRPPVWGWAAAAALLLAVVTPLALQQRPSGMMFKERAEPATEGPAYSAGQKQDAPAAAPPASIPPPQVAARPKVPREYDGPSQDALGKLGRGDADGYVRAKEQEGVPELRAQARLEDKAKRESVATQDAASPAPVTLSAEQAENLRSLGYMVPGTAAPPPAAPDASAAARNAPAPPPPAAAGQRQHGPRSQGAAPARKDAESPRFASAPEDKEQAESKAANEPQKAVDAAAPKSAAGADASTGEIQESVQVTTRARDLGSGPASAKFRSLADEPPPRSDAEARLLREAWRKFAEENPHHAQADEARVRAVEAGALAYRLGRRPQDREIALRDGRAYLDRPNAPQADRVRAALKTIELAAH